MSGIIASGSVEYAAIEAVVIRADGTREDLGVIAEYRRPAELPEPPPANPLRRLALRLARATKRTP